MLSDPERKRKIIGGEYIHIFYEFSVDLEKKLGEILSVPQGFLKRHPFPGPGLAIRILGDVTEGNALETIRLVIYLICV